MHRKLNRRTFLGYSVAAGAAAAVPTIIPASVWGAEDAPPPSETVSVAFIGVGGMGRHNLKDFLLQKDCRVVAVCDVYRDRREATKAVIDEAYGDQGCAMYGDFREVLAREDIDAVAIAVQDHWHALIATAAAKAGKDMYCEKPLGVSFEESQTIRNTIRETKRVLQTGTWQRSLEHFQRGCTLARNGYLGKIHTLEVAAPGPSYVPKYDGPLDPQPAPEGFDWAMWRGPAPDKPYNPGRVAWPDWYLIWDYCVGFICNWGVHNLDQANWGCPQVGTQPFELECRADYRNKGFTDNVNGWDATFTYPGGLKMIFKDSDKLLQGCRFIGEEGWVHVCRQGITAEPESLLTVEFKESDVPLTDSTNHAANFLACMKTRNDPVSSVDSAHIATSLGILADIAARLEQKVAWDPAAERFVDNDAANAMLHRDMHNGWEL